MNSSHDTKQELLIELLESGRDVRRMIDGEHVVIGNERRCQSKPDFTAANDDNVHAVLSAPGWRLRR